MRTSTATEGQDRRGFWRWGDLPRAHRRVVRLLLALETRGWFARIDMGHDDEIKRKFGRRWQRQRQDQARRNRARAA